MPDELEPTRKGKIASLPLALRQELNRRLDDGQRGPQLLAWLNTEEAVLKVLDEHWGEQPINAQNLTEWRQGGYQDHLRRRERVDNLKALSEYALKLGEAAGGSIADGSAAIAGGKIMELLEEAQGGELKDLVKSLDLIRSGDHEREKMSLRQKTLAQRDEMISLTRQKFHRQSAELFLKWYADKKVKEVVESRATNADKIELLGQHIFGEDWDDPKESA
jgi:hypothetical protein